MKFQSLFFVAALLISSSLPAQDHGWPVAAQVSVPDVQVVTQTGEHLRFNSELLKGRVAIVTGFFTTCTSMCPITQESLAHVAKLLGPRLGKDVVIVSLSTDPANDTPARLKAWRKNSISPPAGLLPAVTRLRLKPCLSRLISTSRFRSGTSRC